MACIEELGVEVETLAENIRVLLKLFGTSAARPLLLRTRKWEKPDPGNDSRRWFILRGLANARCVDPNH